MRLLTTPSASAALCSALFGLLAHAQTYTTCNPLTQSCPANPALGGSTNIDFTSGPSSDFTPTGDGVSYNSNGAQLTVSASGDNPTLSSKWYIMFGHVDFVFKAAPGVGMVSSAILISDDLDEIDWELLGADSSQAQTNFFGKGITGTYDRGSFISAPSSQSDFNTYSVDWTSERILWQLNGVTVRTLEYAAADGQYPQTPMQVKIGSWAGGDSSNSQGTITWAGGPINYADGPFDMQVQSISATDYSTGTSYQYSGTDGSWQEVTAIGGSVNSGGGSGGASGGASGSASVSTTGSGSVSLTGSSPSTSTSYLTSLGYDPHHPHTSHPPSSPSSSPSSVAAPVAGGCKTITEYNQQGFIETMTVPSGWSKSYNNKGFLVTPPPCSVQTPAPVVEGGNAAAAPTTLAVVTTAPVPSSAQPARHTNGASNGGKIPKPFDSANDGLRITTSIIFAMAACAAAGLALIL